MLTTPKISFITWLIIALSLSIFTLYECYKNPKHSPFKKAAWTIFIVCTPWLFMLGNVAYGLFHYNSWKKIIPLVIAIISFPFLLYPVSNYALETAEKFTAKVEHNRAVIEKMHRENQEELKEINIDTINTLEETGLLTPEEAQIEKENQSKTQDNKLLDAFTKSIIEAEEVDPDTLTFEQKQQLLQKFEKDEAATTTP